MSWNYRLIDHGNHVAVHEVYYDGRGRVCAWTSDPVTFVADSVEGADGLRLDLARALSDALRLPVLDAAEEAAHIA